MLEISQGKILNVYLMKDNIADSYLLFAFGVSPNSKYNQ